MSISDIIAILRKWMLLIIILPVLAAMAAGFYFYSIAAPVYTSEAQILVFKLHDENNVSGADLSLSANIINDFRIIVTTTPVLQQTAEKCGLELGQVRGCSISVVKIPDTRVVKITVSASTRERAEGVARALSEISKTVASEMLATDNITIIEPASAARQTGPASLRNTVVAFIAGLIGAAAFSLAVEMLNTTVRSEKDVERFLKIPVLGKVPRFEK
ncbi:MAG: Wzz/FepE/Etk N-terminal domain-containing protein [Clostridiales bacterium]|nr:Wzz/FepE/Etk N-terminal domain-containing protein [Clostridiales bacterium]